MQSDSEAGMMQIGEAERILGEVDRVRWRTRRHLHPMWFANLVIGVFFAGATLVALVATSSTLPIVYWGVGIPVGLALIVRHEMRRERAIGAEAPLADPALGVFAAIVAGVVAVNALTGSEVAWAFPVAAGWLAIAALYRDALMCAAGVALVAITTAVIAVAPEEPWAWVQGALAALLIVAGLTARAWERS